MRKYRIENFTDNDLEEFILKAFKESFEKNFFEKYNVVADVQIENRGFGDYSIKHLRVPEGTNVDTNDLDIMQKINLDVNDRLTLIFPLGNKEQLILFRTHVMQFHINALPKDAGRAYFVEFEQQKVNDVINYVKDTETDTMKLATRITYLNEYLKIVPNFLHKEYKLDMSQLRKLGRILADNGYIKKVDATSFHLMQGGMVWLKPKTMLVYLIEQIRSDGKCPYKETGLMFNVNLKPNNKKDGYTEIDEMIKMATLK